MPRRHQRPCLMAAAPYQAYETAPYQAWKDHVAETA